MNGYKDVIKSSIYGLAIGDALGVPVEFLYRDVVRKINIQEMEGSDSSFDYKKYSRWADIVPKGCWSDDTAMALATIDAICNQDKSKSLCESMMDNYISWIETGKYSSLDRAFGVGNCCLRAIAKYRKNHDINNCGCNGIRENGNGALMRILPSCLYIYLCDLDIERKIEMLNIHTGITHAHPISLMGSLIYFIYLDSIIRTKNKNIAFDEILKFDYQKYYDKDTIKTYSHILTKEFLNKNDIEEKQNGYVVDTIEAVLFSIMNNDNFKDSVLCAINLGYDTDTTAAITGSICGALYGFDNIPESWIRDLKNKEYLDSTINSFCLKLGLK